MTKQVAIELLKQGNTGNDILSILDVIVADEMMTYAGPVGGSASANVPAQPVDFDGNPTEF